MTAHRTGSRRHLVVERDLDIQPSDALHRFTTDPARWLPGHIAMSGATTFHVRIRLLGVRRDLGLTVGIPWTRGTTTTRRLRIDILDPPLGLGWALPAVDGELTLVRAHTVARLRYEAAPDRRGLLHARAWIAGRLMRTIVTGIAGRLGAPHHYAGAARAGKSGRSHD